MSGIQFVMEVLRSIWNGFFGLEWPGVGLTFGQVFIGAFVVFISMRILLSLLGLGAGAVNMISHRDKRVVQKKPVKRSSAKSNVNKGQQGKYLALPAPKKER